VPLQRQRGKEAKRHKARIYFIDEASFRSDSHRGTTWGKRAKTPVVKDSGGCFNFKLVSAVSAKGDMYFDVIEERMNSDKFIEYLKKLRKDAGHPIFVIADNAKYHHSKKVQEFLNKKEQQGRDGKGYSVRDEYNSEKYSVSSEIFSHA